VGFKEGIGVVGALVGVTVVGFKVGFLVGLEVGFFDVGFRVGLRVGFLVGDGVGPTHKHANFTELTHDVTSEAKIQSSVCERVSPVVIVVGEKVAQLPQLFNVLPAPSAPVAKRSPIALLKTPPEYMLLVKKLEAGELVNKISHEGEISNPVGPNTLAEEENPNREGNELTALVV
jgi:hypothetical protein